MCIICRMREAGMSEEVEELAEELMRAFQTSMAIHEHVLNEDRKHSAKEVAALYGMRDAMAEGGEPEPAPQPRNALNELLGKMVVVQVRPKEGEDLQAAIDRSIAERTNGNNKLH